MAPLPADWLRTAAVLYESWLLSLVVRRGVQEYRQRLNNKVFDSESIIFIVTRDNIVYYV